MRCEVFSSSKNFRQSIHSLEVKSISKWSLDAASPLLILSTFPPDSLISATPFQHNRKHYANVWSTGSFLDSFFIFQFFPLIPSTFGSTKDRLRGLFSPVLQMIHRFCIDTGLSFSLKHTECVFLSKIYFLFLVPQAHNRSRQRATGS